MASPDSRQCSSSELSQTQIEQLLKLQHKILEQVASGAPVPTIFMQLCSHLEQSAPGSIATIRLYDRQKHQLVLTCAPSLSPDERTLINAIIPGPGQGSAASAVLENQPACIQNINTDPRWDNRRPLAKILGLKASCAWPVIGTNNQIEGAISLSQRQPGAPSRLQRQLLATAAQLAGIVVRREQMEEVLHSTAVRLHQVTSALPGVVFQIQQNIEGNPRFTFFSHHSRTLLAIPAESILASANEFFNRVHIEDREQCYQLLQRSLQLGDAWQQEFRLITPEGRQIWLQVSAVLDTRQNRNPTWNGIFLDITGAKNSAEQLHLAATAFATTREGIVISGPDHRITDVNAAFCQMTGYSREEILGQTPAQLRSQRDDDPFFQRIYPQLQDTGLWRGETWHNHKDGKARLHHLSIQLVRDEQGRVLHQVSVYTDINRQRESEQQLQYLNDHDTLTHLPNRQLFNTALTQWLNQQATLTVMVLGLDRFRHLNESMGHEAGDRLLAQVASVLRQQLTPVDVLARLSGDQFAILLPMINTPEEAQQIARQLVSAVDRPFDIAGRRYFNTASIGIACAPDHGDCIEQLIRHADTALNHAKNQGRNGYRLFSPQLSKQIDTWMRLEPELRNALEQQQFVMFYQPQVEGHSGRIIGAEALIRWQHPRFGMISPADFLPIVEESGLMPQLGHWVLENVCQQLACWRAKGLRSFRLAINLSGPQIIQGGLATQMAQLLAQHALPASMLELEILETFAMENEAHTAVVLSELRSLGIELALDDFGTGYSSLAYLKKLPIQKVKIDRSLIRDLPDSADDKAIARAVIALGKSLSLKVCAEGVEKEAQHAFLRNEGCDQLQGYLFNRPLPATALEALLWDNDLLGHTAPEPDAVTDL